MFDIDHCAISVSLHVTCLIVYSVVWVQVAVAEIFVVILIVALQDYCNQTLSSLVQHQLTYFHSMCFHPLIVVWVYLTGENPHK